MWLTVVESREYQDWRRQFIRQRVRLGIWLAVVCIFTFDLENFYSISTHPEILEFTQTTSYEYLLRLSGLRLVGLLLCGLFYRSSLGRRHPEFLILGIVWAIAMPLQIVSTLDGVANADLSWNLLFLTQAVLVPVCWRFHLVSQLVILGYFLIVNSVLGLHLADKPVYAQTDLWLWWIWLCVVCNLAAFLYERIRRSEFESRRELQVFLHAVTHDLRAPAIGTALVLKTLLQQPGEKVKISLTTLQKLGQGSDRQLALIQSLLETHQTELQGLVLHRYPLPLSQVVTSAIADLEPLLLQHHVCLLNEVSADLPLINADPTQIWRVLSNLITNAIKHGPLGIQIRITATVLEAPAAAALPAQPTGQLRPMSRLAPHPTGYLYCAVQDTGTGIPESQLPRLFDLYSRGSQSRRSPGLGLGLYLCHQIVTAHGGAIGVNSRLGVGTEFWFTLPLAQDLSFP